ncbi:MAG: sulfotransferase family 2 domain-containing protein [Roseivivax sp.]|nr:sulfotransferase family 2 domain-containing protein [Roseivivax sp.]
MALPKAACTSVKMMLAQAEGHVPDDDPPIGFWHDRYPTRRFRPHRWQQARGHWRFCVIRDPAKRLLSVYTDRVAGRQELRNSRRLKRVPAGLPADPDPDLFFSNLLDYCAHSSAIRHHCLPARLFLGPRLDFDAVYHTGQLPVLARDLGRRSGRTVRTPRANASRFTLDWDDLEPETQEALIPVLEPEYAYFKGYFEPPF